MRILIVDQCCGTKEYPDAINPVSGEALYTQNKDEILEQQGLDGIEARHLYHGRQQNRIGEAVDRLRAAGHEVDLYYVSAGFGVVEETERLPPYEATFKTMDTDLVAELADLLSLTEDTADLLSENVDLAFFALGDDYYSALDLDRVLDTAPAETTVALLNRSEAAEGRANVVPVPAGQDQAEKQGTTALGLKGTLLKNFAAACGAGDTVPSSSTIVDYCLHGAEDESITQSGFDDFA